LPSQFHTIIPVAGDIHGQTGAFAQRRRDVLRNPSLVFNDQRPHGNSFARLT
jgi:hypothetical protein